MFYISGMLYRCMYKDKAPLEVGDLYWHLKESVGKYELVLLRSLKFNMHVQLPHPVSTYPSLYYEEFAWSLSNLKMSSRRKGKKTEITHVCKITT